MVCVTAPLNQLFLLANILILSFVVGVRQAGRKGAQLNFHEGLFYRVVGCRGTRHGSTERGWRQWRHLVKWRCFV